MRVFLDSSVVIAACASDTGASRHICEHAEKYGWKLMVSPYVGTEVDRNLTGRSLSWGEYWKELRSVLLWVEDVLTVSLPVVFTASKDKPVLFSAYAFAEVLLTLDGNDFRDVLGREFYGLAVRKPADFLIEQRQAGKL